MSFISCHIVLATTSSPVLIQSDENRHLALFLIRGEKTLVFDCYVHCCRYFGRCLLSNWRCSPFLIFSSILKCFSVLNFIKCFFYINLYDHVIFLLYPVDIIHYTNFQILNHLINQLKWVKNSSFLGLVV